MSWCRGFALASAIAVVQTATAAVVIGRITDLVKDPIPRATVLLISTERVLQATSDEHGGFTLVNVPAGSYELRTTTKGFRDYDMRLQIGTADPAPVAITMDVGNEPDMRYCGPHTDVSYRARQTNEPRLQGTILQESNRKPLKGAAVSLWRAGDRKPTAQTRSDKLGGFALDAGPGYYLLRISKEGYQEDTEQDLLLPRENLVVVRASLAASGQLFVCQ